MKHFVFLVCVLCVLLANPVVPVSAHILRVDKNIGVNIHIEPNDQPIVGKESKIFVDIQDQSGRFNPGNPESCICMLSIYSQETLLDTLSLVSGGTYAQLRYTFPKSGTYTIIIEGKPSGTGAIFQAFRTEFEYYALGEDIQEHQTVNPFRKLSPTVVLIAGLSIIALIFFPFDTPNDKQSNQHSRTRFVQK